MHVIIDEQSPSDTITTEVKGNNVAIPVSVCVRARARVHSYVCAYVCVVCVCVCVCMCMCVYTRELTDHQTCMQLTQSTGSMIIHIQKVKLGYLKLFV